MLTEHELGAIQSELQRWSDVHRSTVSADRGRAEEAARALYRDCNIEGPSQIIWCRSPAEIARSWYAELSKPDADRCVKSDVIDDVRQEIDREIIDVAHAPVRFQLINAVRSQRQTFGRFIADQGHQAGNKALPRNRWLNSLLSPFRRTRVTFSNAAHCFKTDETIAIYAALLELSDSEKSLARIKSYVDLAREVEWILPYGKTCWLGERPTMLSIDANGRCHASNGPAIVYGDGTRIYAWKGVEMTERAMLDPRSISVYDVARTRDPVVRRCLIDLMTPERFIALRGATCIARDECGSLWRRSWRLDAWAAVEVINGTPEADGTFKKYFLQVPAHFQTARQAVAWTYGLLPEQYTLRQRT